MLNLSEAIGEQGLCQDRRGGMEMSEVTGRTGVFPAEEECAINER